MSQIQEKKSAIYVTFSFVDPCEPQRPCACYKHWLNTSQDCQISQDPWRRRIAVWGSRRCWKLTPTPIADLRHDSSSSAWIVILEQYVSVLLCKYDIIRRITHFQMVSSGTADILLKIQTNIPVLWVGLVVPAAAAARAAVLVGARLEKIVYLFHLSFTQ